LRKALQFYEREKLRYFPLVWGEKRPAIREWKPLQARAATHEEIAGWFNEASPANTGIICGKASGGLVALCFNHTSGAVEFFGQGLWEKLLQTTYIVQTPRGVHVYLRSETPLPSQFVAKEDNLTWLEIRANGNYIVAPPSLHPSGILYRAIGVEAIAVPRNLPAYIEKRLSALGLKSARMAQEAPRDRAETEEVPGGEQSDEFCQAAIEKLLRNCSFIQFCRDNATTLTEPYWWGMIHNLSIFGQLGREKIHELSRPYPGYTESETNQKIEEAQKAAHGGVGPHTCTHIEHELGFACPAGCLTKKMGIRSPAGMAFRLTTREQFGVYLYRDKSGWHLDMNKLVGDLLAEYTFKTLRDNEECLVYNDGVYKSTGEVLIKEECETRVPQRYITNHSVNEVVGHVKRSTYADRSTFNNSRWTLNLRNGLYNIMSDTLEPHSPEFLSTMRIPLNYDPDAKAPRIQQFLAEILKEEDVPVIEELFGYCLIPDYRIQRAFLCTGDGANGKSTLLELLKRFLGDENCTNLSLQTIESHRFAVASLFGKLANICADIPSTPMRHAGVFKMLTGGDTIGAEKKFKDNFSFNNHARLIFSSNKPPKVEEDTLAFWRRWIMIDFPNKFEGDKADARILEKMIRPGELSGLLNIALGGLRRLLQSQHYSHEQPPFEVAERYAKAADALFAFVEDECMADPEGWISKDSLYDSFLAYCDTEKIPRVGKESFGRALKNATNIHVVSQRRRVASIIIHGWGNIRLKTENEEETEP